MAGIENIRSALETALAAISPALSTAWENAPFEATAGTAYQICNIIFAEPDNDEYGSRHRELGYMQVKLMYPLDVGTSAINTRAELLRTTFTRGNSFTSSGVVTMIQRTPEIRPGQVEGDRWAVAVIIRFYANI